jgi:hypothetical protein
LILILTSYHQNICLDDTITFDISLTINRKLCAKGKKDG